MLRKLALWLCLIMAAAPAFAQDTLPDYLKPYLNADAPRGHATFRKLLLKVYTANFWADEDDWSYDDTFALSLTYDITVSSTEFTDATIEEMAHVTGKTQKDFEQYRPMLMKAFPTVKPGDTLTALYQPKKPVVFFMNGHKTNQIDGKGFAEAFFGIWLSENTSEPAFRNALLN